MLRALDFVLTNPLLKGAECHILRAGHVDDKARYYLEEAAVARVPNPGAHAPLIATAMPAEDLRLAVTSDIHYCRNSRGKWADLFTRASEEADVLAICGDLTDYGTAEEAEILANDLRAYCRVPVLALLGNHDFESGTPQDVIRIIEAAGARVLDGEHVEIGGVGFVGVSGFGGGFGAHMLSDWGEKIVKAFVQRTVDEALKLERALTRLHTPQKIALLHYSPVRDTVAGEEPELFAYLGSTRLEGPLNRAGVAAAFHGHAHLGAHEGRTAAGIPVFNVSVPVLKRDFPDRPPFLLYRVKRD